MILTTQPDRNILAPQKFTLMRHLIKSQILPMKWYTATQFDQSTFIVINQVEKREICVCSNYDEWDDSRSCAEKNRIPAQPEQRTPWSLMDSPFARKNSGRLRNAQPPAGQHAENFQAGNQRRVSCTLRK